MNLKSLTTTCLGFAVALSPLWISHLLWRFQPLREIDLLVVDYTVPTPRYSHHQGLFWLLNYLRITNSTGEAHWSAEADYVGYRPGVLGRHRRLHQTNTSSYRWIYLADTYGVYDTDLGSARDVYLSSLQGSKLIFGGLSLRDAQTLHQFVDRGGNAFVEFNSFAGPTVPGARRLAEKVVGVRWSGWCGRFFENLSDIDNLPRWFPAVYAATYPDTPLPEGPGIVLIHHSPRIVVLSGEEVRRSAPSFHLTPAGKASFSGPYATPPYFGWFAIVEPQPQTDVLAEIVLPNVHRWQLHCLKAKVPMTFPLLTRTTNGQSTRYYLAANPANLDDPPGSSQLLGIPRLQAAVHRRADDMTNRPAYWQFYVPIIGQLFESIAQKRP